MARAGSGLKSGWASAQADSAPTQPIWRVEGDLLPPDAVRQVAFLVRNTQGFRERLTRCARFAFLAPVTPMLGAARPEVALRVLHLCTRGISRDRLEFLGREYFEEVLRPQLRPAAAAALRRDLERGEPLLVVSSWLDHMVLPLARHLGVDRVLCNRLEFRDGVSTGRLRDPVVPPRGAPSWQLQASLATPVPQARGWNRPLLVAPGSLEPPPLSVRAALRGRELLLLGGTGFIGKVWLANLLRELPEIGRIHLLVRRRGAMNAEARFERAARESPVLQSIDAELLRTRVRVVEGDLGRPGLGIAPDEAEFLRPRLDLIVNSGGITDFNPDLRSALAINVDATAEVVRFQRTCVKAALLHLSTCFVAGRGNGRVTERVRPDYAPAGPDGFDAETERQSLHRLIRDAEARADEEGLQLLARPDGDPPTQVQRRKARQRWLRQYLADEGRRRALELGWPNTYTFTKSLAESQIERLGADLPIAVVRPSIVESSVREPFPGWNEGVNTSAPLAHLLGTVFRQLPSRERKRLDVIPVDLVTRGMTLIAAALVQRRHHRCYQLALSASNPCDMRRSIELTALAHRRHYRASPGFGSWLRQQLETIPVSRRRYRTFSVPRQRAVVRLLRRVLPFARDTFGRWERILERVEKIIELYEPFIHDNDHSFEADQVRLLDAALPTEERAAFGYDPWCVDWPEYWIDIHIPALRRWSFSLIEGRRREA